MPSPVSHRLRPFQRALFGLGTVVWLFASTLLVTILLGILLLFHGLPVAGLTVLSFCLFFILVTWRIVL